MKNHRSASTIDRAGRDSVAPWESLENHAPNAFTVAGASLLASLFVPLGLSAILDRSWLVGIALVGFAVLAAALGLLGLHRRTRIESPGLAFAGAASATTAGTAGIVVLVLAGLTGAGIYSPTLSSSVGKQAFVVLSLTMAAGYGVGFLAFGVGSVRSADTHTRPGRLLTAGGLLLLVPVVGGFLQLGSGIALPAWVVFASLGPVSVLTVAVGVSLRSTN